MKRAREDNTVGIIQRTVKYFRIPVVKSSVKESLKTHPNYPTFKCICDTFYDWNVENYALKYEPEEILELKVPYIVHFKNGGGQIGFVTKVENETVTFYESYEIKRKITTDQYLERCSGAVILLNPGKNPGEKNFRLKWQDEMISKAVMPLALSAFFLMIIYSIAYHFFFGQEITNKVILALFFTKISGIILSVFMILHEFEVYFSFTEKLCHLNKATNCNTVLNDKASKVLGWFGWADAGFIYFTGGLLFVVQSLNGAGLTLLAILSTLTVPYPFFSIYYQGLVLKKWCPMCLGVQIILIVEFILLLPQLSSFSVSLNTFSRLILTYLVTSLFYILFILFTKMKLSDEIHYYKYLEFKKNPSILRFLLLNQTHYEIPITKNSLIFGERHASLRITAFLSLCCLHCARAFEKIREILKNNEAVLINIVLIASDNKILTSLYHYHHQKKDEESLKLLDQWFNGDPYSRARITEGLSIPEDSDISSSVSEENRRLFKECNVSDTPTFFVNGYRLPYQYDIDDIKYLTEIFKGKDDILIGKDTVY